MRKNDKGFTMIELIAVLLIIGVITAAIIPKIIDLEGSAERKLLGAVLSELNARELMAWLECKLNGVCEPIKTDDLEGISFDKKMKNLIFDGGSKYPVHREDATEFNAPMWLEGKPKKDKKPKK